MISYVYDGYQPTLLTLKKLSAITVAFEVWRCEMNKYRANCNLEDFSRHTVQTSLQTIFRDLPTVIYDMIKEYVAKVVDAMDIWLFDTYDCMLRFHYGHENNILYDFDDVVCNYNNCTIDYAKTAERMMACDKFGQVEKFKIACAYFFENDVRRLWPSVWKKIGFSQMEFASYPQLYYWICRLKNTWCIPMNGNETVEEIMLDHCMRCNGPSVDFFWDRLPLANRMQKAIDFSTSHKKAFVQFILPKLDHHELDQFVNERGYEFMYEILNELLDCIKYIDHWIVLYCWRCMRNVMRKSDFIKLVEQMLRFEYNRETTTGSDYKKWSTLCCEIWNDAPHDLKQSVFSKMEDDFELCKIARGDYRGTSSEILLLTILSDATFKQRSMIWNKYWHKLIWGKTLDDFRRIMEMCFENDDKIIQFKENVMAKSKHVSKYCFVLLMLKLRPRFEELNDFVGFCFVDADSARQYKRQILQSNFLGEDPLFYSGLFDKVKEFDAFISDAYESADLAKNFKNQMMSSPIIQLYLFKSIILFSDFVQFTEFMEIFVLSEQVERQIKTRLFDYVKESAAKNDKSFEHLTCVSFYDRFLVWCLGNEEEAMEFQKTHVPRRFIR